MHWHVNGIVLDENSSAESNTIAHRTTNRLCVFRSIVYNFDGLAIVMLKNIKVELNL